MIESLNRALASTKQQIVRGREIWQTSRQDLAQIVLHESADFAEPLTPAQERIINAKRLILVIGPDDYVADIRAKMDPEALLESGTVVAKAPWYRTSREAMANIVFDDTFRGKVGVAKRIKKPVVRVFHTDVSRAYLTNPEATIAYLESIGLGYDRFAPFVPVREQNRLYRLSQDNQYSFNAGGSQWIDPKTSLKYGGTDPRDSINDVSFSICFGHPNTPTPFSQIQFDAGMKAYEESILLYKIPVGADARHADVARPIGRKRDFNALTASISNFSSEWNRLEGNPSEGNFRIVIVENANVRQSPHVPDAKKKQSDNLVYVIDQQGRRRVLQKHNGDVFRSDGVLIDENGQIIGGTNNWDHDATGIGFIHRSTTTDAKTRSTREIHPLVVSAVYLTAAGSRKIYDMTRKISGE